MMVQSRRNQIIVVVVAIVVVIPLMIYFVLRENFFLMRMAVDKRVSLSEPKPLDPKEASYKAVQAALSQRSAGASQATPKLSAKKDIDGDRKSERISATQAKLTVRMSKSGIKYRQRFLTMESIASIGFNDVDGDGKSDVWFARGGKSETDVVWNGGKGRLAGKQILNYETPDKKWKGGKTAFFDIDKDGQVELVFEKGSSDAKPEIYWIKLTSAQK